MAKITLEIDGNITSFETQKVDADSDINTVFDCLVVPALMAHQFNSDVIYSAFGGAGKE